MITRNPAKDTVRFMNSRDGVLIHGYSEKRMFETQQFYDDLASYYHLLFEDWDASMVRQGDAIAKLIRLELAMDPPQRARILDVACGIGTQTLPLAARDFELVARDLSPSAIVRLQSEANARSLVIDAAVADMRQVGSTVHASFDVVLAFDNSLAHLLNDEELRTAFLGFFQVLRPRGIFMCSVRDYDKVPRGEAAIHSYGVREHRGKKLQLKQEWQWSDPMHYQSTFIVDRETPSGIERELSTASQFYAVSTDRLLSLMREAGFDHCRRMDGTIYQPILIGKRLP
jgi:SAM-dependent methyltransferase